MAVIHLPTVCHSARCKPQDRCCREQSIKENETFIINTELNYLFTYLIFLVLVLE